MKKMYQLDAIDKECSHRNINNQEMMPRGQRDRENQIGNTQRDNKKNKNKYNKYQFDC